VKEASFIMQIRFIFEKGQILIFTLAKDSTPTKVDHSSQIFWIGGAEMGLM